MFEETSSNRYCYVIIQNATYNESFTCPYPGLYYDIEILKKLNITTYLPARREARNQPFLWKTASDYGKSVYDDVYIEMPLLEGNCLVYLPSNNIVPYDCNTNLNMLCLYRRVFIVEDTSVFGKNMVCLFPYQVCYYLEINEVATNRSNFCSYNLANFIEYYQGVHYLKELDRHCWIGLVSDGYANLYWEPDKQLRYLDLMPTGEIQNDSYGYTTDSNWYLTDNITELDCAICEVNTTQYPAASIQLNLNTTSRCITFDISNINHFPDKTIICYLSTQITTFFNTYIVTEKSSQICVNETIAKYFYCKGFDIFSQKIIASNQLEVRQTNVQKNDLVMYIKPINKATPFDWDMLTEITDEVKQICDKKCVSTPSKILVYTETQWCILLYIDYQDANDTVWFKDLAGKTKDNFYIQELRNMKFCAKDIINVNSVNLTWNKTEVGKSIVPLECCGTPVTRTCLNDKDEGAYWSNISGEYTPCSLEVKYVYDLINITDTTSDVVIEKLSNFSETFKTKLSNMQTHYTALIMTNYVDSKNVNMTDLTVENYLNIIDNVMSGDRNVLNQSQYKMNSTDIFLNGLDHLLSDYNSNINLNFSLVHVRKTNISSGIVGWYRALGEFRPIQNTSSLDSVIAERPEVAAFLTVELIEEVKAYENLDDFEVIYTFFANDNLFNENKKVDNASWVVSIDIPDFNCTFSSYMYVIIKKSLKMGANFSCAYWAYGRTDEMNIRGSWSIDTSNILEVDADYLVCGYDHMTHFGMLLDEQVKDTWLATIIAIAGFGLSSTGVVAVCAVSWINRNTLERKNSILIIMFLISTLLLPLALFISGSVKGHCSCIIAGMFLHYSILSQSSWSLIFALFQYRRFVVVFNSYNNRTIIKSCLAGWLLPAFPVILVARISLDNYHRNNANICYLSSFLIKVAVILPLGCILAVNTYNLFKIVHTLVKNNQDDMCWKIAKLTNYLFFLFGLSWIFGFIAVFSEFQLFNYIFNFLNSIQGFVICLYFISTSNYKFRQYRDSISCSSKQS
ncbi:unnamed protein product [Brassicogethes aeneus]|uniref:G-protein coupled receptors family 2 profile 2 domain-containing protein n=1 Tax=Brassicogethes aeneus TaxID=1431903 RepID=A0A9P0FCD9_BRAAE|nr:unnamed protein product [Brassicogethes aeneus]